MKQETEDTRLINIIELASELAHIKLLREWYRPQESIYVDENADELTYTEDSQDLFNEYYDDYLMLIKTCEV
jgi:hypothetical protein